LAKLKVWVKLDRPPQNQLFGSALRALIPNRFIPLGSSRRFHSKLHTSCSSPEENWNQFYHLLVF